MPKRILDWFDEKFWHLFAAFEAVLLIINIFQNYLSPLERVYHSIALLIALLAIYIKDWIRNSK